MTIPILTRLFNAIFNRGELPKLWSENIICPIHKSGSLKDANNYRGISLSNILYKVFANILNTRLCQWSNKHKFVDEAQAGFRAGYSAVDNVFILHAMIQKYLSKRKGRFYVLFIDFEKAFDNISYKKLFESLSSKGVNGKFLKILLEIYRKNNSSVKVADSCTSYFPCQKGTRQGSPQIFNLFINDLCSNVGINSDTGIFINSNIPIITYLLFAGDVACPADTVAQLQRQIDKVENFCKDTGMQINVKKTQIIIFRKRGRLRKSKKWKFGNKPLSVVSFYKYMGILFTPKLKWTKALRNLSAQATKTLNFLRVYNYQYGTFYYQDYFKVFDTMVKPILCYGAEFWGYTYRDIVEKVHIQTCKQFLGVGKTTCYAMFLGDCGRYPLCLDYFVRFIKYWCKLLQMPNNRYPKQCYLMLKYLDENNKDTYACEVRKLLFSYGYDFIWLSQGIGDINSFIKEFRIRVKDIMQQDWHNSLISSSESNLYSQYKSLLNVESYISFNFPFHLRQAFAKFRCSDHKLNIEVGRHYNIPREERICSFCLENSSISVIEDEFHVFFQCRPGPDC